MCEPSAKPKHTSILDDKLANKVIPNSKPKKTVRQALLEDGIIIENTNSRTNGINYVNNSGDGFNHVYRNVEVKVNTSNKRAIVIVTLTMNKIYHLNEGEFNSRMDKTVTKDMENKICWHEKGHQKLSYKIIKKGGLKFEENFDFNIEPGQQLASYIDDVINTWNGKFSKIYQEARDLYHKKYGDDGSPWTFYYIEIEDNGKKIKERKLCDPYDPSWQKPILGSIFDFISKTWKKEYDDKFEHLSE